MSARSNLRPGYAFPGGADLAHLPPTLVLDARNDRLRHSGAAFADELRDAGVDVRQVAVPAIHGFLNSPKGRAFATGMRQIEDWLGRHDPSQNGQGATLHTPPTDHSER